MEAVLFIFQTLLGLLKEGGEGWGREGSAGTKWGERNMGPVGRAHPTPTRREPLAAGAGRRCRSWLFKEELFGLKERKQTSSASRNHTFWKSQPRSLEG